MKLFSKNSNKGDKTEFDGPVDLVYLWCSDKDKKWNKKRRKCLAEFDGKDNFANESLSEARWTDNDELRYSLRSAYQYASWINKIYIITDNQIPEWLDTSHEKIKIIDHKDIIPTEYLPTFNSNVLETYIHHIPGLSEHFLFSNDDTFFKSAVTKGFFFTSDGKPIVRLRTLRKKHNKNYGLYLQIVDNMQKLYRQKFKRNFNFIPHHNIDSYTKEICYDCEKTFSREYSNCRINKFRKDNDIERILIHFFAIGRNKACYKVVDNNKDSLEIHFPNIKADCILNTSDAKLFCLNMTDRANHEDEKKIYDIERALYNEKAPWEKDELKKGETIHIVLAADNNYAQHCAAAMSSVILHSATENKICFHILDGGITAENKEKMQILPRTCQSEVLFYDMSTYDFSRFPLNRSWISIASYYRLVLPDLLPQNIKKCIYLDCDTICLRDISFLYNTDISSYYGAVVEDISSRDNIRRLGLPENNNYFNAGVILFNLQSMRKTKFVENCLEYFTQHEDVITMQDQDILNGVMNGKVKYLPLCWNINLEMSNTNYGGSHNFGREQILLACLNPGIVHFWSSAKPWKNKKVLKKEIYWNSLSYTGFIREVYDFLVESVQRKVNEYKISYKLFNFIPLLAIKSKGGRKVYKALGVPVWKIRKMENNITTKYYLFGIPLLKVSKK